MANNSTNPQDFFKPQPGNNFNNLVNNTILKGQNPLSSLNLSNKNPNDFSQRTERNEFANFLIDSAVFYRTNRFLCTVFPPGGIPALSKYYNSDKAGLKFSCEAVSLPTQTIETFDYKMGNNKPMVKMPYALNYGESVTLVFRMSENYLERKLFLTWQEHVFTYSGNTPGARYMQEYASNSSIILSQIDVASNKIYNTQFTNVYPISVSGIEYNWMPGDEYVKQPVTFAFSKMISEGTIQPADKS